MEENKTNQVVYRKKDVTSESTYGHKKGLDLFCGTLMGIMALILPFVLLRDNLMSISSINLRYILDIVLIIWLIAYFSKKKRRFIVIGILFSVVLLPMVAIGGCLVLLTSFSRM